MTIKIYIKLFFHDKVSKKRPKYFIHKLSSTKKVVTKRVALLVVLIHSSGIWTVLNLLQEFSVVILIFLHQTKKFLINSCQGRSKGGATGALAPGAEILGAPNRKKIYTRYSEVGFTTKKKKIMKLRKIANFSGKRTQILCSAPGAGYPRYAPAQKISGYAPDLY